MNTKSITSIGKTVYSPDDLNRLEELFCELVLNPALKLKLIDDAFVRELNENAPGLDEMYRTKKMHHEPIRFSIIAISLLLSASKAIRITNSDPDKWMDSAKSAHLWIISAQGYLHAIQSTRINTTVRGANGRKLIGSSTRTRVKEAAKKIPFGITKDNAAQSIAENIGLSRSRTLKLLTELFPGSEWDRRH